MDTPKTLEYLHAAERLCADDIVWTQRELTMDHRKYVIEWMGISLMRIPNSDDDSVLFLAVELFDQYLCRYQLPKNLVQHLAIACINLAWKVTIDYVLPPVLSIWARQTLGRKKDAYRCTGSDLFDVDAAVSDLFNVEAAVAVGLGFRLCYPTVLDFLRCIPDMPAQVEHVAHQILLRSLISPDGPHFLPSLRTRAAVCIALNLCRGKCPCEGVSESDDLWLCCGWLLYIIRRVESPKWLDVIYPTKLLPPVKFKEPIEG